ncbi:primosomal protein DnaI [Carnobacteriaceae bacterium zg-C25]|nr:primosomal protein DnaI [Carnobacteriaceae bacterium zg-C25]
MMQSIKDMMKDQIENPTVVKRREALKVRLLQHDVIQQFITDNQIPEDIVTVSFPKFFEYLTEKERFDKTGECQNPGFEPLLMYENESVVVSYAPTKEFLQEQEKREFINRIQTFGMSSHIKNITLNTIDLDAENKEAVLYFRTFLEQLTQGKSPKGAYLYGAFGVGKTHLLGALAGTLSKQGYSSYLAHVPSLVVELKASIASNQVSDKLDTIKKAPILMLDDIGGESLTNWVRDDVFMVILDYRMRENLPTFFTSNLSFDDLQEHFTNSTQTEDERKSMRLMERVKFLGQPFNIKGANRRNQQ